MIVKKFDVVIVDSYASQRSALLAIEKSVQTGLVGRVHTYASQPIYPGEEFHCIAPVRSTADYSHYLLNIIPYEIPDRPVLVIQWDGMPKDASRWQNAFLDWDYIGAPWSEVDDGKAVGNGGFSLRSPRLHTALRHLKIRCDSGQPDGDVEDHLICKTYRSAIEALECRFAPLPLAQLFAVENVHTHATFGFHGVFNMPLFLQEAELLPCAEEICIRTPRPLFMLNFMVACLRQNYLDLYRETLRCLQVQGRIAALTEILQQTTVKLPGFNAE